MNDKVSKSIEKYIFEFNCRKVNEKYRKMTRKIVFDIQYNKEKIHDKLNTIVKSQNQYEQKECDVLN